MKAFVVVVGALVVACGSTTAVGGACSKPADCATGSTCVLQNGSGVCAKTCATAVDCSGSASACKSVSQFGCCSGCACDAVLACVDPCSSASPDAGTCQCGTAGCMPGSDAWCNSGCGHL